MSDVEMNINLNEKTELLSRRKRFFNLLKTRKFWSSFIGKVFMYTILTDFALVFLIPIVYMVISGIESPIDFADAGVTWIPTRPIYQANIDLGVKALAFGETLWETVKLVVLCTLGHVISGALVGYALGRMKFLGRGLVFACVLITLVIPAQTFTTTMTYLYQLNFPNFGDTLNLSVINLSNWSTNMKIIVPCFLGCGLNGGLFIFIFRQVYAGLPKELEEAAMIDGCGIFGTFRRIMLPLTSSAIVVSIILSAVWHWNDLYEPTAFVKTADVTKPTFMSLRMYNVFITNSGNGATNLVSTIFESSDEERMKGTEQLMMWSTFLSLLPLLIGYMFIQKKFMASVASTGIKG